MAPRHALLAKMCEQRHRLNTSAIWIWISIRYWWWQSAGVVESMPLPRSFSHLLPKQSDCAPAPWLASFASLSAHLAPPEPLLHLLSSTTPSISNSQRVAFHNTRVPMKAETLLFVSLFRFSVGFCVFFSFIFCYFHLAVCLVFGQISWSARRARRSRNQIQFHCCTTSAQCSVPPREKKK